MALKTTPFDVAEHLAAPEDQAFLIADAVETGDAAFIRHTLNTVARARGMTQIAREAGVTREALYKALGPDGDPRMSTLLGVFRALGVKLSADPRPMSEAHMERAGAAEDGSAIDRTVTVAETVRPGSASTDDRAKA